MQLISLQLVLYFDKYKGVNTLVVDIEMRTYNILI